MLAADLDARLAEWRNWCLSGRHHRGQAGSLEGRYRSPQRNMWEAPVNSLQASPIAWRAYEVELAVVAMLDPFRWIIVAFYARRQPDVVLRRKLRQRWRVKDPLPVLEEARRRVGAALAGGARPRAQVPTSGQPIRARLNRSERVLRGPA